VLECEHIQREGRHLQNKNFEGVLEGCPTGQPEDAGGQQPVGVILESARDRRVLDWLVSQVGLDVIEVASRQLIGQRRAYPSNVAKFLGLTPPADLALTPRDVAKDRLADMRAMLMRKTD
jgi:hypothetical protein